MLYYTILITILIGVIPYARLHTQMLLWSDLELSAAVSSYLALPGATWSYLELPGATQSYLVLSGAIWSYFLRFPPSLITGAPQQLRQISALGPDPLHKLLVPYVLFFYSHSMTMEPVCPYSSGFTTMNPVLGLDAPSGAL